MIIYIILSIVLFFGNTKIFSQSNICGTPYPQYPAPINPAYELSGYIQIPVFFHVILSSAGEGNVDDSQLIDQITVLNQSFSSTYFSFYLAGVTRNKNDYWRGLSQFDHVNDYDMRNSLVVDPYHVLNIYITSISTTTLGWATFPDTTILPRYLHGIVIRNEVLPGGNYTGYNIGITAVHETGHYLGLYHTFSDKGVCRYNVDYDFCEDTPPHLKNTGRAPESTDTCPLDNKNDPVHNYMNDTFDDWRNQFTLDQKERMSSQVAQYRSNLGESSIYINANRTINSGDSWEIFSGNYYFSNNASLIVNGTLNVNGTSSNPVTFDFSGGATDKGIQINPDGHFDISYAVIDGPGIGMYVNEGWGTIDNTVFNNHFTDLHLYRTNYSSGDVYLTENTFNATEEGLILEYSSPKLVGNKFSGNQYGIQASNYSSAQLGYVNQEGRNVFDGIQWGSITGYNNCNLFLGKADCITNGGYNTFRYNPQMFPHIDVSNYCQVTAEENWWGSNPPASWAFNSDGSSSIDYNQYLTSDPNPLAKIIAGSPEEAEFDNAFVSASIKSNLNRNGTASKVVQLTTGGTESLFSYFDKNWTLKRKLIFARRLLGISSLTDYTEDVKTICKDIIRDNKDSSLCFFALDILWDAYKKSNEQSEFKEYLNTLTAKEENYTGTADELVGSAKLIAEGFDFENEIKGLDDFIQKYKGKSIIEYALYQKFIHQKNIGTIQEAKATAEELGKLFPESRAYELALSYTQPGQAIRISKERIIDKTKTFGLPKKYSLLGNYPNPFNPSTQIEYTLPRTSEVEVEIYDLTGKLVNSFNLNSQSAGYNNITWNGTNSNGEQVSSGIYLYHFKAVSLEGKNETFEKSAKLILLR